MNPKALALKKSLLNDPLPKRIFLDTSFFISLIFSKNPRRDKACKEFLTRLRDETHKNKDFVVCFNTVVYYEAYIAFTKHQSEKDKGSRNFLINNPTAIKPYIPKISRNYELLIEIINGLRVLEIKLNDKKLVDTILKVQFDYGLEIADAFHLGTMLYAGENNMASFDITHFGNIPGINLWCNFW